MGIQFEKKLYISDRGEKKKRKNKTVLVSALASGMV